MVALQHTEKLHNSLKGIAIGLAKCYCANEDTSVSVQRLCATCENSAD